MNFIKNNFVGLIAIALFLFLFLGKCGNNGNGSGDVDTLKVHTETVYVPQAPVVIPQYIPVPSGSQAPIVIPPNYQPSGNYEALLKQYNELVNKHLITNNYDETISLKDTTGTEVGKVDVKASVSENKMKTFGPNTYTLNLPHTTTTITVADNYRRFYGGGGLLLGYPTLVNGVKGDILYKDKKDKFYGAGAGVIMVPNKGLVPYGEVSLHVPLGKKMK